MEKPPSVVDDPGFADGLAENVVEQALANCEALFACPCTASAYGKNILPRVAACLYMAQISEIIKVGSSATFEWPIFAGNAVARVRSMDRLK
jgi:electron transfer flavoprotein alpha subunit